VSPEGPYAKFEADARPRARLGRRRGLRHGYVFRGRGVVLFLLVPISVREVRILLFDPTATFTSPNLAGSSDGPLSVGFGLGLQ